MDIYECDEMPIAVLRNWGDGPAYVRGYVGGHFSDMVGGTVRLALLFGIITATACEARWRHGKFCRDSG